MKKVLIANRGEIAIRLARSIREAGMVPVFVHAQDDAALPYLAGAEKVVALPGKGVNAYLDRVALVSAALTAGADAVHPGYGFLSEDAVFATACTTAGLIFIGPSAEQLSLFGDKSEALDLARSLGVPCGEGTRGPTSLDQMQAFLASRQGAPILIKAIAGGGGRGMRVVRHLDELPGHYERARSEALAAFGNGDVYAEAYIESARHIEVQIIGDGTGRVIALGERECTLQRRHQKIVEIAPSPWLQDDLREAITAAAVAMATAAHYRSLGTFEFLVDASRPQSEGRFVFIEANPRLQVEHCVTEEVYGLDLVRLQIAIAQGARLEALGLGKAPLPRGQAIEWRINAETMGRDGLALPSGGTITGLTLPGGPGIRIDSHAALGLSPHPGFDPLLMKLIVSTPSTAWRDLVHRSSRALQEMQITGVSTNLAALRRVVDHPAFQDFAVDTTFLERYAESFFIREEGPQAEQTLAVPEGALVLSSPVTGTVVECLPAGQLVQQGEVIAVLEAMKMEFVVEAPASGQIVESLVATGAVVQEGQALAFLRADEKAGQAGLVRQAVDLDHIRPDLSEVLQRKAELQDAARPEAVARRRASGQCTARENLAALFRSEDYLEYGDFAVAAQRKRRSMEELKRTTPADGMVTAIGSVNADLFGPSRSKVAALAYDYTVLAGTQGAYNHMKTDRLLQVAEKSRLPVVLFAEGGGGRPGDVDFPSASGLAVRTFTTYARMSGLVPRVGIVSGFCFAGNAALLGCSDVVIATENCSLGMGGPAMIEGGGLGRFRPEEVGPASVMVANGVIDVLVKDEVEAVAAARLYLSYFQGRLSQWTAPDQRLLRHVIPENRLRAYDVRDVITGLADEGSVLELRRHYARGMVTAFMRVEGRPIGVIANHPGHLGGAIDAEGADKAARFIQLCDGFDIPILSLCDTPGFMVGPQIETTAQVRRTSRLFVAAASVTVPFFCVVLRKGYGLGAMAMAAGSFHDTMGTVSWPSGEFGPMGIEGMIRLGFKRELDAIADPAEREAAYQAMVAGAYATGKATNVAAHVEIDSVIDPADTRRWIIGLLDAAPEPPQRQGKKRPSIDTW